MTQDDRHALSSVTDKQAACELMRLVNEAPYLDLSRSEVLALERAIFLLEHNTEESP